MNIQNRINQYDGRSKEIISHKIIIAYIMKGTIPEFKDIPVEEIALDYIIDPNNDRDLYARIPGINTEYNDEEQTKYRYDFVLDFILPDKKPAIMNIELQGDYYPIENHINRANLYISALTSNQSGIVFNHSDYNLLEKGYSVWIYFNPPKYSQNSIFTIKPKGQQIYGNFTLTPDQVEFFSLTFIFLGNNDKIDIELLKLLNVLFFKDIPIETRIAVLKDEFNLDHRILEEVESDMSVGQGLYNSGKYDGMIEGKIKGKIERDLEIIHYIMRKNNSSLKEIMELLGIDSSMYDYYNQLIQEEHNSTKSKQQ